MKKNISTVGEYLRQLESAENASNFSSSEISQQFSNEDIESRATGDTYLNADGDSQMGAGSAARIAKPYVLNITNTTSGTLNAIVFGFDDYYNQTNFGSDTGVTVSSAVSGVPYRRILSQSAMKPFEVGTWRLSCSNTTQLQQSITITYVDANGRSAVDPVNLSTYKDAYQQDNTILDINSYPFKVDGNTYLTIPILANVNPLTIIFFPAGIADQSRTLVQHTQNVDKKFIAPRLSGRNAARVTINTLHK